MAEDTPKDDENQNDKEDFGALTGGDDSGLGNLPPLSDFDSADDTSDGNLPPLGSLDTDSDAVISTPGELPTPGQVNMETPQPQSTPTSEGTPMSAGTPPTPADPGGLVTPEFSDVPAFDTPTSDLDTPEPAEGFGFQDLAADSDFSPETPEIGPGPDSDIETPMFDSAFGGETGEFGTSDPPVGGQTSSPTQAMETPMFDASASPGGGGEFGFDNDAFGDSPATPGGVGGLGGNADADIGTPIPDFSPDTGMQGQPTTGMTPQAPLPSQKSRTMSGLALAILIPIAALFIGVAVGPLAANSLGFFPGAMNPFVSQLEDKDAEISTKQSTINRLTATTAGNSNAVTEEELNRLITQFEETQAELNEASGELSRVLDEVQESETTLSLITEDIDQRNEEYVQAEDALDNLYNTTEITKARHEGLTAENERLTVAVGELEAANIRRQATKEALMHDVDRMIVQVSQGIPLAPNRYSHADRVARVEDLHQRISDASWVDAKLLADYTAIVLAEQSIASSREYFFAKIPVHDRLGTREQKWAECLMNGNWSVYFLSIDGEHVGAYENVSANNIPEYQFREDLPETVQSEIRDQIIAARVEGYEEKVAVLQEKQEVYETETGLQRNFSSL